MSPNDDPLEDDLPLSQPAEAAGEGSVLPLALTAAFLALSLAALATAYRIAGLSSLSSPGAVPLAASLAMVAGAGLALRSQLAAFRRRRAAGTAAAPRDGAATRRLVGIGALAVLLAVLLEPLGFLPAAALFLFPAIVFLAPGRPVSAAAITILALAFVYAVFRLVFEVVLPEGIVPEREIIAAVEDALGRLFGGPAGP